MPDDKTLDDLCAKAEAMLADGNAETFHVSRELVTSLLAERKAWKEGRPMDEAPRDGTRILVNLAPDDEFIDVKWVGYGWSKLDNEYEFPKRWWPLPGDGA